MLKALLDAKADGSLPGVVGRLGALGAIVHAVAVEPHLLPPGLVHLGEHNDHLVLDERELGWRSDLEALHLCKDATIERTPWAPPEAAPVQPDSGLHLHRVLFPVPDSDPGPGRT